MNIKERLSGFLNQACLFFSLVSFALFAWHRWWSGVSPRLIRGSAERDAIHHAHLSIGATLFVFLIILFLIWLLRPGLSPLEKLKKAFSDAAHSAISVFFISFFFASLYGLAQAWAADEHTKFLGVFELPHFLDWAWNTSGYLHSSFASLASAFFAGIVFIFLYVQLKKYMKPGLAVGLLILLHLLIELPKPPSLHPIAAFGAYVLVPSYYFIALAIYSWANNRRWIYWPIYILVALYFMYLPYFAFKVLPPWHQKPAAEIVLVESASELSPIRSRSEIFPSEESLAAAMETSEWCLQCHKIVESDEHLLGPNLLGVFNQQAGTVEGYGRYSQAVVDAGQKGIFWNRENLADFFVNGQEFIPGNLMNSPLDLSDPEKLEQVLDLVEYLSADE